MKATERAYRGVLPKLNLPVKIIESLRVTYWPIPWGLERNYRRSCLLILRLEPELGY